MFETVLRFWFDEIKPASWWKKDPQFDQLIEERFGEVHRQAVAAELADWRAEPLGRLAEIIVLDQFSRNIYRDDPRAFTADGMALVLAQEAIAAGSDKTFEPQQKSFLYMPFMHSESSVIHEQAVQLFTDAGLQDNVKFTLAHKAIIDRFGRYPHRNEILGRESSEEEIEFLKTPGSSF